MAVTCALGTVITWRFSDALAPSEFAGGSVTGKLVNLQEISSYMFPAALIASWWFRRVAALLALIACALAIPLYAYFISPGLFRVLLPGPYSIQLGRGVFWDPWAFAGLLTVALTVYFCFQLIRVH
jgi:hypothetical protein